MSKVVARTSCVRKNRSGRDSNSRYVAVHRLSRSSALLGLLPCSVVDSTLSMTQCKLLLDELLTKFDMPKHRYRN